LQDTKGNVAILFGVALIPLLIGAGMAIDYGRALIVRERMADAADAAALAIGSWPGLSQAELQTKAQQFFAANYPPSAIGTVGTLNVNFAGDDIKVSVSGEVPTTFMKLAHFDSLSVGVNATITKKQRNIELVLVLDITGSMNSGGKLSAMKSAAKKMIETLFDGKATSDSLKVGIVPFSAAVNVGTDKRNSGWIDTATYPNNSTIAKEDFGFTNGQSAFTLYDQLRNRDWAGCVRERGGSYELTDDPPGGSANSKWAPYFAPDEPSNNSNYVNDYLNDGSYSRAQCPGGSSTAEKRQCYTGKYNNVSVSSSSKGPQYNCPPSPIVPMTNVKSTVINAINALDADGYTVIPAGLLWGWRAISPTEPFTEGKPYDDEKWVKAIVLLTDGENDVEGGSNSHDKSNYNAFGYAKSGHLGSTNGSDAEETLDDKTLAVCGKIKGKTIRLYTIGFQVTTASQNLLKNCASKPDMFYNSPTNDQLAGIFQDIAQGLSELRIAQ
jgi:Flp pilus assembly protein TadG